MPGAAAIKRGATIAATLSSRAAGQISATAASIKGSADFSALKVCRLNRGGAENTMGSGVGVAKIAGSSSRILVGRNSIRAAIASNRGTAASNARKSAENRISTPPTPLRLPATETNAGFYASRKENAP